MNIVLIFFDLVEEGMAEGFLQGKPEKWIKLQDFIQKVNSLIANAWEFSMEITPVHLLVSR